MNQSYEAALTMYAREHDRWNQWALFFFGAIGAIYYVASRFSVPAYVPAGLACLVSVMWVCAALSIRATTDAWRDTLLELEAHPDGAAGAFHVFARRLEEFDKFEDFKSTLKLWTAEPYTSVTRLLVLFGVFASVAFLVVTITSALGCLVAVTEQS